jgi:predicted transcriptional regulator
MPPIKRPAEQLKPVLVEEQPATTPEPKPKRAGIHVNEQYNTSFPNFAYDPKFWKPAEVEGVKGCRMPSANAVLLYLWLIDKVTSVYEEDGRMIGKVLGGMPIGMATIANADNLNTKWGSVQRGMAHLVSVGLVRRRHQAGDGSKKTREKCSYEVLYCRKEFKNGVQPDGSIQLNGRNFTKNVEVTTSFNIEDER